MYIHNWMFHYVTKNLNKMGKNWMFFAIEINLQMRNPINFIINYNCKSNKFIV